MKLFCKAVKTKLGICMYSNQKKKKKNSREPMTIQVFDRILSLSEIALHTPP